MNYHYKGLLTIINYTIIIMSLDPKRVQVSRMDEEDAADRK